MPEIVRMASAPRFRTALDDGDRVSIGGITLALGEVGLEELRQELRETIFEDDVVQRVTR